MAIYNVSKQFGHVVQIFEIEADSDKEAWDSAEFTGKIKFQTLYREIYPLRNYVTKVGSNNNENVITKVEYDEWIKEAYELGMIRDYYDGLPFTDV